MKKILLINAHQFYEGMSSGGLNKTMEGIIKEEAEKRGYPKSRWRRPGLSIGRLACYY
ncbi:hypothetical protein [Comamonas sp. 26]|uniref:hypothetical protein n=1 Tax=Comamonas sp. 26 TaxID=2035201 RepID=UPI0018EA929E|nr:hypothetical protein [Comamonas sp. 26]